MSDSEVENEFHQPDEDAPNFFDFLPLPLMLLNSLIFSLLFEDSSEDESDDDPFGNDTTLFNGRPFAAHPWQMEIKDEMLKPVKGGSLFELAYCPVANAYSLNGEPSERCFHLCSHNIARHNDDDGNYYLSRPIFSSYHGNAYIEWPFDFGELQKNIVCAKAQMKSELLKEDSSLTWSILIGNQKKWKVLRTENKRSVFAHSINLTEYLSHEKKFRLKVELSGRGKKSLPGQGSTKLFEQHESQTLQSDNFHLQIWLADDSITSPIGSNLHDHSRLINQAQGSDLVLLTGDRTLHAHRTILSDRSDYFKALLDSGMEEARKGQISFPDIDSRVLLQVLKFIYSAGSIPDKLLFRFGQKQVNGKKAERVDVTDLLLLAGRLNLIPLIQRCEKRLIPYVDLSSATDLLALAIDTGANQLRSFCEVFIDANHEEIKRSQEMEGSEEVEGGGEQADPGKGARQGLGHEVELIGGQEVNQEEWSGRGKGKERLVAEEEHSSDLLPTEQGKGKGKQRGRAKRIRGRKRKEKEKDEGERDEEIGPSKRKRITSTLDEGA